MLIFFSCFKFIKVYFVFFENSNPIGDVMVCVFGRSAVDRGSESRSGQTVKTAKTVTLVLATSPQH
jgi:hypothetical protein